MIGTTLHHRYRLDAELDRGGMGVVYRAHDLLLDRPVAVKVLNRPNLGPEGRARLLNEARAAARLDHPNIVAVYDAGQAGEGDDGTPFIVMQLVEGESLRDQPPSSLDETLAIAGQICAALNHAHTHGIVHRDLKPENILITPEGVAKLMDFGLALSAASRLTDDGSLAGTVFYLAPEQVLGQEIDGRADLYALGVMLYELVTGRLPFTADDPVAVLSQHLHAPVVPPTSLRVDLLPAVETAILKLLAKSPADRFATAAEAAVALAQAGTLATAGDVAPSGALLQGLARGRLVGRRAEVAQLRDLWARAQGGQASRALAKRGWLTRSRSSLS
jgi:serine/threonine protein kinase